MSRTTKALTPELHDYLLRHNHPQQDDVLRELADETADVLPDDAGMQIAPEQGAFMTVLTRTLNARYAVEVGTFTGYSSLCIARGLADGGRLLCCDVSEEFTAIARRYWERAGVADRIELRLAPGVETLRSLPADPPIDLAFIDADKEGYVDYWEEILTRMRPGGVVLVDNVLSNGRVVADDPGPTGIAIKRFNDHAAADDRVELAMLPIADGLTFARKR
jgi:predicted O-methyltransferase YrrM